MAPVSGHVYRYDGVRRSVWRAKYRLPDGRQVKRTIGPAWTERGRPRSGFFTRRTAEDWLAGVLQQAREGTLPGMVRTDASVADAADEYLRVLSETRGWKPSTIGDYRSVLSKHILPVFGDWPVEDVTADDVERWARGLA